MSGFGEKIGRMKEAAILALLSSRNVEEAARTAGVTARTLYRWQKEPEFDAAYREARRVAVSQANSRLQQASGAAATTILKLMVDSTVPATVRIRACECVLNHANKTIEIEDTEMRLAALEETAQKAGQKTKKLISSRQLRNPEETLEPKASTEGQRRFVEAAGGLVPACCRTARTASIRSPRVGRNGARNDTER